MAKSSSQRRFEKRVKELRELYRSDPNAVAAVWERYVRGWLIEIQCRSRAQKLGGTDERRLRIFEVHSIATTLANAIGASDKLEHSLKLLEHECATAVSRLMDPNLYPFHKDSTSRVRDSRR